MIEEDLDVTMIIFVVASTSPGIRALRPVTSQLITREVFFPVRDFLPSCDY
jgi:hypothetical protein